ncbi:AarF/UbiB family protein [Bdellovibrio sp. KM01]|uniref:AarF/UbiB family protein n=1 Tax=Bdellovibrio sp. KM01 TaxID=2748865 RepID=UPI0015EAE1A4|nr:AarF/UbiB family protein [Bdellovibrio sp. KM01]QLY24247.1 AarF/ABC1/UbiB kinase family protein [Bdellovibrio sp. KM01]
MLNKFLKTTLIVILMSLGLSANAAPKDTGLYLSFEQRLAVTYALMASGETTEQQEKTLDRGIKYFQAVSQKPVQEIEVKSFNEFLAAFRGQWPDTQSVNLDLDLIEKDGPRPMHIFRATSYRVQRQIDDYIDWQLDQLKSIAEKAAGGKEALVSPLIMSRAMAMLNKSSEGHKALKHMFLQNSDKLFQGHLKEFDRIGEKIATSGLASTQDPAVKIVMQTMLSEYFARLSLNSKKLIVSSFLGGDLRVGDMQKFEVMVQNSGPQLQKLLQIVARQGDLSPEMTTVFKRLEDAVRPVPYRQVEELLKAERQNYEFVYFEQKALGVGTMAQVHRAKILFNGRRQDVVVRFIKPDIEMRVQEDSRILKEVAEILDANPELIKSGMPKISPLVSDVTATVTAELSQEDTVARQKFAATRYNQEVFMETPDHKNVIEFHVPEIYPPVGSKTKLMVQEMVLGQKLDKEAKQWNDVAPQLKQGVVEALVRLWGTETLFGEGFYHSDLHQGNFLVQFGDEKIRVNLLDFGMGGKITRELQENLLLLETALTLRDAKLIGQTLWDISSKSANAVTEAKFKSLVSAKVKLGFKTKEDASADEWTKWALNNGLRLPYDFININRGLTILKKLLEDSGSKKDLTQIMSKVAIQRPRQTISTLVGKDRLSTLELIESGRRAFLSRPLPPAPKPSVKMSCSQVFN